LPKLRPVLGRVINTARSVADDILASLTTMAWNTPKAWTDGAVSVDRIFSKTYQVTTGRDPLLRPAGHHHHPSRRTLPTSCWGSAPRKAARALDR
jgi:hypothetical protein